jgi:LacI family transcriptional regulator
MRAKAVQETAAAHGATALTGPAWHGEYSANGGARVIRNLLDNGGSLPDAIACANDQSALGAVYALRERGYRIPEDVLVTGFDDIPLARHTNPPLTTVRQPVQEMGSAAFDALYSMIDGKKPEQRQLTLPVELVLRTSCGCAPQSPAGRTAQ